MGTLKKIGSEYIIEFYARGLKYQQKAGADKRQAETLLKEIEEKIAKGEATLMVRDVDLDIFLHDFLENARTAYPEKTAGRYTLLIEHFGHFIKLRESSVIKLSQVTPRVIEQYKSFLVQVTQDKNSSVKPKVAIFTMILLRDIFEYAIKLGYLNDNPTLHVKLPKVSFAWMPRVLTEEDIGHLLSYATAEMALIVEAILLTGISIEELIRLKWSDIDWKNKIIRIQRQKSPTKMAPARELPLTQRTEEIFARFRANNNSEFIFLSPSGKKFDGDELQDQLTRLVKQSALRGRVSFLTFRNTFAVELVKKGLSLITVMKLLGFNDVARILAFTRFMPHRVNGEAHGLK